MIRRAFWSTIPTAWRAAGRNGPMNGWGIRLKIYGFINIVMQETVWQEAIRQETVQRGTIQQEPALTKTARMWTASMTVYEKTFVPGILCRTE